MTTWRDRVRKGYWTSPSGSRIEFDVEEVSRETELANTPFEFPGVEDAYVQVNEHGGRRLPIRAFFSGPQHDLEATVFEIALIKDTGIGRLEHPLYGGPFDVVPVGSVARRNAMVAGANQTVIEVTFWKTLRAAYPSAETDPKDSLEAALAAYKAACATQFSSLTQLDTLVDQAQMRAPVTSMCRAVDNAMGPIARLDVTVSNDFADALSGIVDDIDTALTDPEQLATDLVDFVLVPAEAVSDAVGDALTQLEDLADTIMGSDAGTPSIGLLPTVVLDDRSRAVANAFYGADLMASSCVAAGVSCALTGTFESRPDAINAAETILDLFDTVNAWRDAAYADLSGVGANHIDTGEAYQALHEAVSLIAGYLVEVSFDLIPERVITLQSASHFIPLCAKYYGSVSNETQEKFIRTNALTGDELWEIPAGREIVYYAAA